MTKEQVQWIGDATEFCVKASDKKVLILLIQDAQLLPEDNPDTPGHQVVVTNAQTPAQICWLMRAINGEESGCAEPDDADEASE